MKAPHRTLDRVEVPARPLAALATPDFRLAAVTTVLAVACLATAGVLGDIHGHTLRQKLAAGVGAAGFLAFAVVAVRSTANEVYRVVAARTGTGHAGVLRVLITLAGYAVVVLTTLGLLSVPVQHLLLGTAITGVIVGIAAQQSLGNVFAGLVLLLTRPFNVGDDVRIRSGALGGEFSGRVTGMGLTYTTVDTDDGPLSLPNSTLLAAGIGPRADEEPDDPAG